VRSLALTISSSQAFRTERNDWAHQGTLDPNILHELASSLRQRAADTTDGRLSCKAEQAIRFVEEIEQFLGNQAVMERILQQSWKEKPRGVLKGRLLKMIQSDARALHAQDLAAKPKQKRAVKKSRSKLNKSNDDDSQ
jgi:hypothetical protein